MFSSYERTGKEKMFVSTAFIGEIGVTACNFPGETGYMFSVKQGEWMYFFNSDDYGSNRLAFQAARAWQNKDMAFFDQFNSMAIEKGHSIGFSYIRPVWL